MKSGDASNDGTTPCDPKSNNLMQKELLKVISILVDMETEDILKNGDIMVVTKKFSLTCADLLYHKTKNILILLCTPTFLIYNSEMGIINSSEFFHAKKLWKKHYILPLVSLFYCEVWWEVTT